jgi:predicted permease
VTALVNDLRHAVRLLANSPGLAAAAIISMALGIGANTALFSVTSALLLRPLPYADPDRLVILWNRSPGLNITEDWFSTAQYFDIRNGYDGFEALAIAIGANMNLSDRTGGEPERVGVIRVSSNLLPMLGARPVAGRLFEAREDAPGQPLAAILSHGTWTQRYGADANVIGQRLTLNGQDVEIAGVLPASFSLPREVLPTLGVTDDGEIFLPLPLSDAAATVRTREDYNIIGKLRPDVTVAQVQAAMDAITARLRRDHPDVYPPNGGLTFSIVPLHEQVVGGVRTRLGVLTGAVGCVLLIACANVANLLLSRAVGRRKELAVRASLGASGARIVRQLLTESVLLASAGGMAGLALAAAGIRWVKALQPRDVPRLGEIALDSHVLAFTLLVSVAAGLLFGLAPAFGVRRLDLHTALKDTSRGATGGSIWGRGPSLRRALGVTELALAVVLVIGAGLLLRSVARLQEIDPGFSPGGVLALELSLAGPKYPDAGAVRQTYRDLWTQLDALPGVAASGGVTTLPLSGFFAWGPITVEGRVPPPGEAFINADQRTVAGRYFEAMGIPLVRGRLFDERDTAGQPRAVIIDERMAGDLWPNEDPIGKRLRYGDASSETPWETVVGVVGRVKQYALDADSRIALYRPHGQSPARSLYVVVKSATADVTPLAGAVRNRIRAVDPDLPIYRVRPMSSLVSSSMAQQRFSLGLLALFAGIAVSLAAVGLYSVLAYLVAQGRREIGIRLALGATSARVLRLVIRQGLILAGIGCAIGLAAALALGRVVQAFLYGVGASDPATFLAAAGLLSAIALIASAVPAVRAARVDPMTSLRDQ